MFSPGDCILINTNKYEDGTEKAHLFIIITEAIKKTDKIILIPLCTINPNLHYDKTVILQPGVHDFIKELTYVEYSSGKVEIAEKIDKMITQGKARIRLPKLKDELLEKVCNGILKSKETPYFVASYYEDYLIKQF